MKVVDLVDDEEGHRALSYVWGPKSNMRPIYVNGYQVHVTQNLFDALKAIRKSQQSQSAHSTNWWVDALCINQDDMNERNHQIKLMRIIYLRADSVLAWLGPSPDITRTNVDETLVADLDKTSAAMSLVH